MTDIFQKIFSRTMNEDGILSVALLQSFEITPAARAAKLLEWYTKQNEKIEQFYIYHK